MAEDIEPQRKNLNNINKSYSSDLFQLLNKFIRHDTSKNEQIEKLTNNQNWCAFPKQSHKELKELIEQLKK